MSRSSYHRLLGSIVLIALAALPAAVKLHGYPDYPGFDDAFIHLAIVQNVVAGSGWGINIDQPVNMTSCPLYTVVMAGLTIAFGHEITVGMILSGLFGSGALLLFYRTARMLGLPAGWALVGMALAAFNFALWRWYGTVMETTMTYFSAGLVLHSYYRWASPRPRGFWITFALGLLLGMAVLVRFELAVLAPCLLLDACVNRRPGLLHSSVTVAAGSLVAVVPWLLFALAEFGDIVPTTYYSKTSGGLRLVNPTVLVQISKVVGASYVFPLLASAAAAGLMLRRKRSAELVEVLRSRLAVFLAPVLYLGFYYVKTDVLGSPARYVLPALYALPLSATLLLHAAGTSLPAVAPVLSRALLVAFLGLHAGLNLFWDSQRVQPVLSGYSENYWRVMRETATWLAERCEPDDVVLAVVDVGTLAYYGRGQFRIADAYKLASPDLRGIEPDRLIDHVRPRFVVETQGAPAGADERDYAGFMMARHPDLTEVRSADYAAHGIADPDERFSCRVYRYREPPK